MTLTPRLIQEKMCGGWGSHSMIRPHGWVIFNETISKNPHSSPTTECHHCYWREIKKKNWDIHSKHFIPLEGKGWDSKRNSKVCCVCLRLSSYPILFHPDLHGKPKTHKHNLWNRWYSIMIENSSQLTGTQDLTEGRPDAKIWYSINLNKIITIINK